MVMIRHIIGEVLREIRLKKGFTLKVIANRASVALGYLSELERGHKEASSEVMSAVMEALEVKPSEVMAEVTRRLQTMEIPDTVPAELVNEVKAGMTS